MAFDAFFNDPIGTVIDAIEDWEDDADELLDDILPQEVKDFGDDILNSSQQITNQTFNIATEALEKVLEQMGKLIASSITSLAPYISKVTTALAPITEAISSIDLNGAFVTAFESIFDVDFSKITGEDADVHGDQEAILGKLLAPQLQNLPSYYDENNYVSTGGKAIDITNFQQLFFQKAFDHPWAGIEITEDTSIMEKYVARLLTLLEWFVRIYSSYQFLTQQLGGIGDIYIGRPMTYWAEYENRNKLLDPDSYIRANIREIIPDSQREWALFAQGLSSDHQEMMINLAKFFPSATDLIDLAVKEAFDPEENLLIHGENSLPEPFVANAPKSGLDLEWAQRYWHAHWRLIGTKELFDLKRRGLIEDGEYNRRMRLLDYDSSSRDLVKQLLREPINRVDSRRLYAEGVIDADHLKQLYLTQGYSEEDSIALVKWNTNERSVSNIDKRKFLMKQFQNGFLSEAKFVLEMNKTGLTNEEVEAMTEYEEERIVFEEALQMQHKLISGFVKGIIPETDFRVNLTEIGMPLDRIEELLDRLEVIESAETAVPTKAELKTAFQGERLTEDEVREYLRMRNYDPNIIEFYIQEWSI